MLITAHIFYLIMKAVLLGLSGGLAGYLLGTVAAIWLGPQFAGIAVSPLYILLPVSVVLSVFIAVGGSLAPAYMAGKIEPFSNMQED